MDSKGNRLGDDWIFRGMHNARNEVCCAPCKEAKRRRPPRTRSRSERRSRSDVLVYVILFRVKRLKDEGLRDHDCASRR